MCNIINRERFGYGVCFAAYLLLAAGADSVGAQTSKQHIDFSMGVAEFTMTQRWAVVSNAADVATTGAVDVNLGMAALYDECGVIILEDYFFQPLSDTKLLAPIPCDEVVVSLGNSSDDYQWATCDGATETPDSADAWARTRLCDIGNGWWELTGDMISHSTFVMGSFEYWNVIGDPRDDCDFEACDSPVGCCGVSYMAMPAAGYASALLDFDTGRSIAISGLVSAEAYAGIVSEVWCGLGVGCGGAPAPSASVLGATLVTFGAQATDSNSTIETDYEQGLLVWYDDLTAIRLGVFADSAFAPSDDGQGGKVVDVVDHPVSLTIASADVVDLEVWSSSDSIQSADGEVDRVAGICWNDRLVMQSIAGSSIGDGVYSLRGDFDLDGDVDATDVMAFNDVGCTADVNCDGSVNTMDWIAYLNLWNASDASADTNMDGLVNSVDVIEFLNTYGIGC